MLKLSKEKKNGWCIEVSPWMVWSARVSLAAIVISLFILPANGSYDAEILYAWNTLNPCILLDTVECSG